MSAVLPWAAAALVAAVLAYLFYAMLYPENLE